MKGIVSVIGTDKKGIIAKVSGALYDMDINVEDISQTLMQNYFTMIMMVDLSSVKLSFNQVKSNLKDLGETIGVQINIQNTTIFDAMHKI